MGRPENELPVKVLEAKCLAIKNMGKSLDTIKRLVSAVKSSIRKKKGGLVP